MSFNGFTVTIHLIFLLVFISIPQYYSTIFFYSIEWRSNGDVGDTFGIKEISLYRNNKEIELEPDVSESEIKNPDRLTDGQYKETYPVSPSFVIRYDFGSLTPVNKMRIVTTCGDIVPSIWCNNSFLVLDTSTGQLIIPWKLDKYDQYWEFQVYDNQCASGYNILLADPERSSKCGWQCESCLEGMY